jgi:hypothetical protein
MKKNRLKPANDQFKTLLGITGLGFEDKFPIEILSSFQTSSYLIRDKGEVSDKISYEFHISGDKSSVLSGIRFSIISKEINAILDSISSKPELSYIPKYKIVLDPYEDTIIDKVIINNCEDLVREICSIKFIENEILNEQKLVQVADLCKVYINDYMQPFFDSINSLQDINDKIIEITPMEDYNDFFRNKTVSKALIVMGVCKNERFESYYESALKVNTEALVTHPSYSAMLNENILINEVVYKYFKS